MMGRTPGISDGGQAAGEGTAKPVVQPEAAGGKAINKDQLSKEIAGMNKWLQVTNSHVQFKLHDKLNEYYVQVVNDQTNEVIREIPSKKVLDMVAKFHEMAGLLVDERG